MIQIQTIKTHPRRHDEVRPNPLPGDKPRPLPVNDPQTPLQTVPDDIPRAQITMIELEGRRARHAQLSAPFPQEPWREIKVIIVGVDSKAVLRKLLPVQTADLRILTPGSQLLAGVRDSLDASLFLAFGHIPPG